MKIFGAVWFIKKQNNEIKTKLMGKKYIFTIFINIKTNKL